MTRPPRRPPRLPEHECRPLSGRRVVVTCGSGFIGSRVVDRLCRAGAPATVEASA